MVPLSLSQYGLPNRSYIPFLLWINWGRLTWAKKVQKWVELIGPQPVPSLHCKVFCHVCQAPVTPVHLDASKEEADGAAGDFTEGQDKQEDGQATAEAITGEDRGALQRGKVLHLCFESIPELKFSWKLRCFMAELRNSGWSPPLSTWLEVARRIVWVKDSKENNKDCPVISRMIALAHVRIPFFPIKGLITLTWKLISCEVFSFTVDHGGLRHQLQLRCRIPKSAICGLSEANSFGEVVVSHLALRCGWLYEIGRTHLRSCIIDIHEYIYIYTMFIRMQCSFLCWDSDVLHVWSYICLFLVKLWCFSWASQAIRITTVGSFSLIKIIPLSLNLYNLIIFI